jgi:hypothetical protein
MSHRSSGPESSTVHSFSVPLRPSGPRHATSAQAECDAPALQGNCNAPAPQGDCNAPVLRSDRDASEYQDAVEPSRIYEDSFIYQTPAISHWRISEHTRSYVTPAPQPLITTDDLATLSRDACGHTHHQSKETLSLTNKPISSPLCKEPSIPTPDGDNFSIINLTDPKSTPQFSGTSSLLPMEDPTHGEFTHLLNLWFVCKDY